MEKGQYNIKFEGVPIILYDSDPEGTQTAYERIIWQLASAAMANSFDPVSAPWDAQFGNEPTIRANYIGNGATSEEIGDSIKNNLIDRHQMKPNITVTIVPCTESNPTQQ